MNSAVATCVQVDRELTKPIENLAEFLGRLPGCFTDLLGMQVEQAGVERTVLTMACRRELTIPYGVIHGGAVAALADLAAGIAMMASLRPGESYAQVAPRRRAGLPTGYTPIGRAADRRDHRPRLTAEEGMPGCHRRKRASTRAFAVWSSSCGAGSA